MKTLNAFTLTAPFALMLMGSITAPKTLAATFNGRYTIIQTTNSVGDYEIGKIQEYVINESFADFYGYQSHETNPSGDSSLFYQFNGQDDVANLDFFPDQLHLFMVRSTTSGEIGLFSVNGDPDGNNGDLSYLTIDYKLVGQASDRLDIAVSDDFLNGKPEVSKDDTDSNLVHGVYGWVQTNTDGAALSVYDQDGDFDWFLEVDLVNLQNNQGYPNETMYFLSSDNNALSQTNLENGTTFRIIPNDENNPIETVPEPSNLNGLLILGFLGGGLIFLEKR